MKCPICRKPMDPGRKTCSGECRSKKSRRSRGIFGPPGRRPKDRSEESPKKKKKPGGTQPARKADSRKSARTKQSTSPTPPRIAFDRQLLPQAPLDAAGYRLAGRYHETGEWVLMPDAPTGWKLDPFQSPNDSRLVPGNQYRVLWANENGGEVPPEDTGTIPELCFFTGPADPEPPNPTMDNLLRTVKALRAERLRNKKELRDLSQALADSRAEADSLKSEVDGLDEEVRALQAEVEDLSKKSIYQEVGEVVVPFALGIGARQILDNLQRPQVAKPEAPPVEVGSQRQPESASYVESKLSPETLRPAKEQTPSPATPSSTEDMQRLLCSVRWAHRALSKPLSEAEMTALQREDAAALRLRLRTLILPDDGKKGLPIRFSWGGNDRFLWTRNALRAAQKVSSFYVIQQLSSEKQGSSYALAVHEWMEALKRRLHPDDYGGDPPTECDDVLCELLENGQELLEHSVPIQDTWGGIFYDCLGIVWELLSETQFRDDWHELGAPSKPSIFWPFKSSENAQPKGN